MNRVSSLSKLNCSEYIVIVLICLYIYIYMYILYIHILGILLFAQLLLFSVLLRDFTLRPESAASAEVSELSICEGAGTRKHAFDICN